MVLKAIHTQLPSAESLLSWGNMSFWSYPEGWLCHLLLKWIPKYMLPPQVVRVGGEVLLWEVRYYFVPVCKNDLLDSIPRNCLLNDLKQDWRNRMHIFNWFFLWAELKLPNKYFNSQRARCIQNDSKKDVLFWNVTGITSLNHHK